MKAERWTRIIEIVIVIVLMAAALAMTLFTASAVRGQPVPPSPASPSAPRTPAAPPSPATPPDPAGSVSVPKQDVSLALLVLNRRHRRADSIVSGLGQTLVAVSGRRLERPDADRLAAVLAETLLGRDLGVGSREWLAAGLTAALTAPASGGELERALGQVRSALASAGLGDPDLVLVDRELRRATRGRP